MSRFIQKHRLRHFRLNPNFPVNTLLLMRGAIAAGADGRLLEYTNAGMRFMWEDGANMDNPIEFAAAFDGAGFDSQNILHQTRQPEIKAKLLDNTNNAVSRGAFGVPTIFVKDEIYFGKERVPQVEAAIVAHGRRQLQMRKSA